MSHLPTPDTKNVLVIGRHADMLERVTEMLRANGYHTIGAMTNEDAVAKFNAGDFQAVVIGGGVDDDSRELFHRQFSDKRPGVAVIDAHPRTILLQLEKVFGA